MRAPILNSPVKKLLLTAVIVVMISSVNSQPYFFNAWITDWAEITDNHMQPTRDGGYIMTSYVEPMDDSLFNLPWCVIAKIDSIGNPVWMRKWALSNFNFVVYNNNAVCQTADGGFAVASTFIYGTPGSPPVYQLVAIYVVKLDSMGNYLWSHLYPDNAFSEAYDIDATPDGGIIISGRVSDTLGGYGYLLKTDSLGRVEWGKRCNYLGYGERMSCVRPTSDGGYISAGITGYPLHTYIMKTDSVGVPVWTQAVQGFGEVNDVREIQGGGFMSIGHEFIGNIPYVHVMRYDAGGNPLWRNRYMHTTSTTSYDRGLAVTPIEDGSFTLLINYYNLTPITGMMLVNVDSTGQPNWSRRIIECGFPSGELYREDDGYVFTSVHGESTPLGLGPALIKTNDQGANCMSFPFVDSAFAQSLPFPITMTVADDTGSQTMITDVMLEVIPTFYVCPTPAAVQPVDPSVQLLFIYENPVNELLQFGLTGVNGSIGVTVIDVLGRTVYSDRYNVTTGEAANTMGTTSFESGMYFLLVETPSGYLFKKPFVVQH